MNEHGIMIGRPTAGVVGALEATGGRGKASRSGYARDKYPERVEPAEAMGLATPIASEKGQQEGRPKPHERVMPHYPAATAQEASMNMAARAAGRMARIEDGLDQPGRPKPGVGQYDDERMEMHDDPARVPGQPVMQPSTASGPAPMPMFDQVGQFMQLVQQLAPLLAQQHVAQPIAPPTAPIAPPTAPIAPEPTQPSYFKQRVSVGFASEFGTYTVPAVSVQANERGVMVILPTGGENATFVPQPGARLTVQAGERSWRCLYPGTAFIVDALNVLVLTFLRDEREETTAD